MQGVLPHDIIRYIFSFFPIDVLCGVLCKVCKLWNEIANSNSLWKRIDVSSFAMKITDKILMHLALRWKDNLIELSLAGCMYITDTGVDQILSNTK
jgi:hypothetical protein